MTTMRRMLMLYWLLYPLVLANCEMAEQAESRSAASDASMTQDVHFEQKGYFANDARDRVRTFLMPAGATVESVRAHGSKLTATPGRTTAAYYYEPGSIVPADGVTLAGNIARANRVIYEDQRMSAWRYAFMVFRTGETSFVDCAATPSHDLCRQ
jgi:hypothetical protein